MKSLREILVPAVVVAGVFVLPGEAGATVTIESPTLVPGYSSQVTDFTVRCAGPVVLSVAAGREKVSVDGRPARTGSFAESVPLRAGQAFRIRTGAGNAVRTQTVRCLPEDFPFWNTEKVGNPQAQWYVTAPDFRLAPGRRLPVFGEPYVAVANRDGVPVWWFREPDGVALDAKLVDRRTLAWTIFRDGVPYRFRRLDGRIVRRVGALTATTNFHDLAPTADGGYLAVGEQRRDCPAVRSECVDLSAWGGSSEAVVIDNVIEKVDRRGRLVWRWTTRGNVHPAEVGRWVSHPSIGLREYEDGRWANDLFHVNSVVEDGRGAIVSLRHADAVYRIGDRGRGITWKLGGTPTPKSLNLARAISGSRGFSGQHDARLLPDKTVSLLDNGSFEARGPRVLRYQIGRRSATLVEKVQDSRAAFSVGNGSARRMRGGNWAVAWGAGSPFFSEVTRKGRPVLTMTVPGGLFPYRVDAIEPGRLSASDLRSGMDAQYPR